MKTSDDDHWMGGKKRIIEMDAIWLVTALVLLLMFVTHCNGTPTPSPTPTMTPWPVPTNTPTPWPTATKWPTPLYWPTPMPCDLCCVGEDKCAGISAHWVPRPWLWLWDGTVILLHVPPEEGWEQWCAMSTCFYVCRAHMGVW